ncbi:MAG: DNA cytosine methyltransferase [Deltaproteobacteria bacterium]|nr:DNA cytosine methyltransferase [Deltaproteobacteria bacterium]
MGKAMKAMKSRRAMKAMKVMRAMKAMKATRATVKVMKDSLPMLPLIQENYNRTAAQAWVSLVTDCSGMEAPVMALKAMDVQVLHLAASESNQACAKFLKENFHPRKFFDSVARDNVKEDAPKRPDLYVTGFPCQNWSVAGLKKGALDEKNGPVIMDVIRYIAYAKPKAFVLENVEGLMTTFGSELAAIVKTLKTLDENRYKVDYAVLCASEHGIPQRRRRLWIVGIDKSVAKHDFKWPPKLSLTPPLSLILDSLDSLPTASDAPPTSQTVAVRNWRNGLIKILVDGHNPFLEDYVLDIDGSKLGAVMHNMSPCQTRQRHAGHWVTSRGRRMRLVEQIKLMGMRPSDLKWKGVVTDTQLAQMVGNSMCLSVLERIFYRLLPAAGLARPAQLKGRWESYTTSVDTLWRLRS